MRMMKFTLFTPHHKFSPIECDSVKLCISDSSDGKFSGSYGIRKGHAKAVFSLAEGKVTASLNDHEVFSVRCSSGFATIENDNINVVVDCISDIS